MKSTSLGEFEELVLLMVAAQHDQAYGVSVQEALANELDRSISISGIHMALKRLDEKGFVRARYGGITQNRGGRRKKFYVVTSLGKEMLDRQYEVRARIYHMIPNISFI